MLLSVCVDEEADGVAGLLVGADVAVLTAPEDELLEHPDPNTGWQP